MNRRGFLLSALPALTVSCRRPKAEGFSGYAFVANAAGQAVAVVDLGAFAAVRHIRLDANPTVLQSHPAAPLLYALTPQSGCIHEIGADSLSLGRTTECSAAVRQMRLTPDGAALWLLAPGDGKLLCVRTDDLLVVKEIRLPGPAVDFDLSPDAARAAVSLSGNPRVVIANLDSGSVSAAAVEGSADLVRFRSDGRQVLCTNRDRGVLSILDAATSEWIVHLPLSVEPHHLCFKPDGGQLFITGAGQDAVVTVHPYETQIASTTLAGRAPGPMAASVDPGYLFIANPDTGDVTVMDIESHRVVAVVTVGSRPGFIALTPDSRYALVLNEGSGDMAIIRVESLTGRRRKAAPLFTMVPVGSRPIHAVVRVI